MKTQKYGYKCLLCGDVIYRRTRWDDQPHCRCGNLYFSDYDKLKSIVSDKYKEVTVELGEGVDETVLEKDETELAGEYGVIESEISNDELEKVQTKILLLRG